MSPVGTRRGRGQRGFTLLELVVAMTVFALVGLGLFGVLVLGARSAGSGERVTEQARRYRIANEVLTRQVASTEPIQLPPQEDSGELGGEGEGEAVPFFHGEEETVEFVTSAPQRPDASGMAIVRYWVEDGTLRMSERPVFSAYGTTKGRRRADGDDEVGTVLLYDVESVTFSYLRESDSDDWLDAWEAEDEEQLPAVVRIDVRPSADGGPDIYHEIPVMVGAYNQVADADEDFRARRVRGGGAAQGAGGSGTGTGTGAGRGGGRGGGGGGPGDDDEDDDEGSPGATLPDDEDDEDDE